MRKYAVSIFICLVLVCTQAEMVSAERSAQCDPCGLCKDTTKSRTASEPIYIQPQSWSGCFTCLYPTIAAGTHKEECVNDEFGIPLKFKRYINGVETEILSAPGDLSNTRRCDTLKIDPATNEPLNKPQSGRQYSDIGCISVSTENGRFNDPNASVDVVQRMLAILTSVTGAVGMVFILISAGSLLTSKGDPEKIREGKRRLTNTIIGVAFTFFALFIFRFIASSVLRIPGLD